MADPHNIVDPFHRRLHNLIAEKYNTRQEQLVSGIAATIQDYKEQVGYLQALRDLLDWADEIEDDMYGKKPKKPEDEENG